MLTCTSKLLCTITLESTITVIHLSIAVIVVVTLKNIQVHVWSRVLVYTLASISNPLKYGIPVDSISIILQYLYLIAYV